MSIKDNAHNIINSLPDNVDLEDIMNALYVNMKFAHGEEEIKQGKGISQDDAVSMMRSWQK